MPNQPSPETVQVNVKMPKNWKSEIKALAERDDRKLSDWVRLALRDAIRQNGGTVWFHTVYTICVSRLTVEIRTINIMSNLAIRLEPTWLWLAALFHAVQFLANDEIYEQPSPL